MGLAVPGTRTHPLAAGEETPAGEDRPAGEETPAGEDRPAGEETPAGEDSPAGEDRAAGKCHDAMAQKGSAGTPSLTSAAVERLHILYSRI